MNKKIFIFTIFLIILVFFVFSFLSKKSESNLKPQEQTLSTRELLLKLFAMEYGADKDKVMVELSKEIGDYARGNFKVLEEEGIFLAHKRDGQWLIVFSGNTPLPCAGIEKYNFPMEMVPECASQEESSNENAELINAQEGKTFSISLDSNPSTGYSWQAKYDQEYFELVDQRFETSSDLIGAGGKEIFIFKALRIGEKFMDFQYLRTWEKDKVEKTKAYKIIVE